jgi:hypothetical protein
MLFIYTGNIWARAAKLAQQKILVNFPVAQQICLAYF